MRDIAGEAIDATTVGGRGAMKPAPEDSLSDFQAVVAEADRLQAAGVILIIQKHRESQTAARFVDRVLFQRLR